MLSPPPLRAPAPARLRRARWVVACLWLLVALMPLRVWAAATVIATAGGAPAVLAEAGLDLPPCHAGADGGDSGLAADPAACTQCLFCAPMLANAAAQGLGPLLPGGLVLAAAGGLAPEGVPQALFKPPRG